MRSMIDRARWVALVVVVLVLVGVPLGTVAQTTTAPEVRWEFAPADGAVYGQARSDDGRDLVVVLGYGFDPGGTIVSLDPASGAERWRLEIDESPSSSPIIENGVVYAGIGSLVSGRSAVYALDVATGRQLWRTDISNSSLPATPVDGIALGRDVLFVNRADGVVLALSTVSGKKVWDVQLPKPQRGAPVVEGELVYISTGFDGAAIYALDATTGAQRWMAEHPRNPSTGPVVADGAIIVPFEGGHLIAFDPMTGNEQWRADVGIRSVDDPTPPTPGLPLIVGDTVVVTSVGFSGASTEAYGSSDGVRRWISPAGDFSGTPPALGGGIVIVGSDSGELLGLDPTTGAERWRVAVPNKVHIDLTRQSPPLVTDEWIFVPNDAGGVVGFELPG